MSFQTTLNQLMKDTGVSNVSLGKAVGVSDVAVMKWKRGEAAPSLENAVNIARYFGISVDDLAGVKLSLDSNAFVRVPVIGTASAFGINHDSLWAIDYVTVRTEELSGYPHEECFALSVRDNTMAPEYTEEISYPILHQQSQCADGDTAIIRNLNTNELMFKVFHWDKNTITLSAPAGSYKDIVYRRQDINKLRIEAVVIGCALNV